MTRITATSKRLLGLLVVVVLLFAIGASGQRLEDEQIKISEQPIISDPKMVLEAPAQQGIQVDTSIDFEVRVPEVVRHNLMAWALSKRDQAQYTPEQIAGAIKIYEETPLSFESSVYLVHYCEAYSVDPALVLSIIEVESRFNQHAVGSSRDRGYMQIIPSTEKWLARSYGEELGLEYNPKDIFEPEYNLGLAIRYISDLEKKYGDNDHRVLSEYNRGSVKLASYFQTHQTYQTSYSRSILRRMDKYAFDAPKNDE